MALESSSMILYVAKISYQSDNWWKLLWRTKILHTHIPRPILCLVFLQKGRNKTENTERDGSVVTHETRIREGPGSNPGADQPDWGFFVVFLNHQGKCWVGFSLPRSI